MLCLSPYRIIELFVLFLSYFYRIRNGVIFWRDELNKGIEINGTDCRVNFTFYEDSRNISKVQDIYQSLAQNPSVHVLIAPLREI